ncbi:hypothetical protein BDI4_1120036 [Burkholderia diffusa]|nr:hypothetical protein BDI4_1120036 [Burkholderia diffusa]
MISAAAADAAGSVPLFQPVTLHFDLRGQPHRSMSSNPEAVVTVNSQIAPGFACSRHRPNLCMNNTWPPQRTGIAI